MAGAAPAGEVQAGDRFVLLEPSTGERHLVEAVAGGARKQKGLGVFDPARFVGEAYGSRHRLGEKSLVLLRPTLADLGATVLRKAQIVTPKDASRILYETGIGPGDRVLESGIGSAALTVALAWAVGEQGRIVVQELREEFADWGRENLRRAGLDGRVEVHLGDLTQGLAPGAAAAGPFAACVLDQPEPWRAIPHLVPALAPGATVACYTPQVSQMEETHRALATAGLADLRCMELIERRWEVRERGSRPAFEGLGHTGFLVFGRWLGTPVPPPQA
jgi:tRNA (adenine57-N1/adenine58-N1)-methyltransferase catalytic subunit